jgi:hypothetical protein
MDKRQQLTLALQHVEGIAKLTENLEYRDYIYKNLIIVKCELERELSKLDANGTST